MARQGATAVQGQDMRSQIVRAATQLFADRGFDGTTLQAIADQVGIRKASLLYHFQSKDELRRSVLDQLLAHWNEALPRLLDAGTTGRRRFTAVVGEVIAFFVDNPARARLLLRETLDRPGEMRELFARYFRPCLALVTGYIRRGQQEGIIHADMDPEAYVLHVFHSLTAGIAMREVFANLLAAEDGAAMSFERHTRELTRMAQASLFLPRWNEETGGDRG